MSVDLLTRLSNAPGLSGFEDDVQAVVTEALQESCEQTWRDRLGNVSAFAKAFMELTELGLVDRAPRFAVITAAGADTFFQFVERQGLRWNGGEPHGDYLLFLLVMKAGAVPALTDDQVLGRATAWRGPVTR